MLTYFIADLHLTEQRPDITGCFLNFLNTDAKKAESLYILGDLFEVWIGDDDDTALHRNIASALSELADAGTKIFFIHGNRDFMLGKRFAKKAKMTLLPEKAIINIGETPVLVMHGDTLCTDDVKYQEFRKMSRAWWWKTLMGMMPLSYRRKKAKQIQDISAAQKSEKSLEIMDVNQDEVRTELEHFGVDLLIHGHTHRPNIHTHLTNSGQATRYVLGDWYEQGAWLKVENGRFELLNKPFQDLPN